MAGKNIGRLVPVKKQVHRVTATGDMSEAEITYYTKPKEVKPGREKGAQKEAPATKIGMKEEPKSPLTPKEEKPKITLTPKEEKPTQKATEVAPPAETVSPAKPKAEEPKIRLKSQDEAASTKKMLGELENYDDFKKIGVDPKAAELFFCRI